MTRDMRTDRFLKNIHWTALTEYSESLRPDPCDSATVIQVGRRSTQESHPGEVPKLSFASACCVDSLEMLQARTDHGDHPLEGANEVEPC